MWHECIPKDEIWLKIGGDKGGGTFKMAFEIANLQNPNAKQNTVVFSIFKGPYSPHNLQLGLHRYFSDIEALQRQVEVKQAILFCMCVYFCVPLLIRYNGPTMQ